MLVEDSARWIEAADGELLVGPGPRLGLASVLLLRERRPALGCVAVPEGAAPRW
jgi:hypothetical protein